MAFDAVIYQAEPTSEAEKSMLEQEAAVVLVVNFDNLRLKKVKHVAAFASNEQTTTTSWATVRKNLKAALPRAGGTHCLKASAPRAKPYDIRLYVTKRNVKAVTTRLIKEMDKHKLTVKKVSAL
jgi:hypothetical protein